MSSIINFCPNLLYELFFIGLAHDHRSFSLLYPPYCFMKFVFLLSSFHHFISSLFPLSSISGHQSPNDVFEAVFDFISYPSISGSVLELCCIPINFSSQCPSSPS